MAATVTNRELAQAFRKAIPLISTSGIEGMKDGRRYICYAISDATEWHIAQVAKGIVMTRLYPYSSLGDWLRKHIGEAAVESSTQEQIQAHRIAWTQALAEEFENKD